MVSEAYTLIKKGNRGKAKELLVDLLKNDPENGQAWALLSHCVNSQNKKIYCLKKALSINPENKTTRQNLFRIQKKTRRKRKTKHTYIGVVIAIGSIIFIGAFTLLGIYSKVKAASAYNNEIISDKESSYLLISPILDESSDIEEVMTFSIDEINEDFSSDIEKLPLPDIPEAFCVPRDSKREYGKVLQVLTADSILVEMNEEQISVRYIGIDTSTLEENVYAKALEANQSLVGQNILLVQDKTGFNPDSIYPRYVFIGNTFVNYQLLSWGFGTTVNNPPDNACNGFFLVAQEDARNQHGGVWALPVPEKWREWPVIPEISYFSRLVYTTGLALGNDPHGFSVIGDCQSLPNRFLARVDWDSYTLSDGYDYLQSTVDWFAGEYSRNFVTVRDSATVATMFSPLWADSNKCKANENPLECEFRLNNPSVVLISLGTNWRTRSVEEFELYLRNIVEFSLNHNVLPIIATKADATTSDYPLNYAMARVAYDFDIPLWNFWSAVQYMPYQGMDPEDVRGIHILSSAYPVKRITALQVLHEVLKSVDK
ncbi:MAG: hypothetical protein PVF83_14615 [Anaerolineales bacterium]